MRNTGSSHKRGYLPAWLSRSLVGARNTSGQLAIAVPLVLVLCFGGAMFFGYQSMLRMIATTSRSGADINQLGLNILARVNASGAVTMVINQNVTAPIPNPLSASGASGSSINSPSFSQRNVSTQVTVNDGEAVAIGGAITENHTESSAGIPLLHRIPVVGGLFGAKNYSTSRTELIIFLTPHVIYDTAQITDATEEIRENLKRVSKLIKDGQ